MAAVKKSYQLSNLIMHVTYVNIISVTKHSDIYQYYKCYQVQCLTSVLQVLSSTVTYVSIIGVKK